MKTGMVKVLNLNKAFAASKKNVKLSATLYSYRFTIKELRVPQCRKWVKKIKTAKGRELGGLKIIVILGKNFADFAQS